MFVPCFFKLVNLTAFFYVIAPVACLNFDYQKFDPNDTNIQISPDSAIADSAIQVTLDNSHISLVTNLSGRAWYAEPFKLWRKDRGVDRMRASFNSTFVINISPFNSTTPVGEGLAFILTVNYTVPENSYGQWLGIVNEKLNGSSQIVAIEFDTVRSYPEEPDDNHIGLDVGSIYSTYQVSLNDSNVHLSNGKDIRVNVLYDGKNKYLSVFVAPNETTEFITKFSFSESIDLSNHLPEDVYVGFSASTSHKIELNCVKSWSSSQNFITGS